MADAHEDAFGADFGCRRVCYDYLAVLNQNLFHAATVVDMILVNYLVWTDDNR
jgi:hypothetical protein